MLQTMYALYAYHHKYAKTCTADLQEDIGKSPDYLYVTSEHGS